MLWVHSIVNLGKQKWSNRQDKYVRGGEQIYLPHFHLSSYRKNETLQTSLQKVQAKFIISGCKEKKTLLRFGLQNRLNLILSNSVKEGPLFKKKKVKKIEFEVSAGDERLLLSKLGQTLLPR